jgi:hypothetical protein
MRADRARATLLMALAAAACGCGESHLDSRVGEVHLHQYPSGGIVSTLFVNPPTPLANTELDSALPNVYTPAQVSGPCKLILIGSCAPHCAPPDPVDGGTVEIDGLEQPLSLSFNPRSGSYADLKTDALGAAAGTAVQVRATGAAHIAAFSGEIALPLPLNATTTLDQGLSGGLEIDWTPADPGASILIELTVVPRMGSGAIVRCILDHDHDNGLARFRVPDELLASVPAAPRLLDLEVARFHLDNVATGGGRSVVLHGSDSLLFARDEP